MIPSSSRFRPQRLGINTIWDAANPNGNGVIPADGTLLSSISDLGINGNTITQSTPANQIVYKKNIINGQNVFRFSGAQNASIVGGSGNNYSGPLSVFAIGMATTVSTSQHFLSKSPSPTNNGYGLGVTASAQQDFTFWGNTDIVSGATIWTPNVFQVVGVIYKSDNSVDFYKNRNFVQNVAGAAMLASTGNLVFGSINTTGLDYWHGDFVAVFLAFAQLTPTQISWMLNYCCARIGL